MAGYISLTLGTLSITLKKFIPGPVPRLKIEQTEAKRTALGYIVAVGKNYEDQHLFEFSCLVLEQEYKILDAMYWEYHRRRRDKVANNYLTLIDTTSFFQEKSPRTRATAPSPDNTVTTLGTDNGYLSYYAQYTVVPARRPEFTWDYQYYRASLAFEETEVKVAP